MTGIKIERLFGYFNYHIELADEGITILTGPNGYGKSTIIRCINALRNSDIDFFLELDFRRIEIVKEDEKNNLLIEKKGDELQFNNSRSISKEDNLIWKRGFRYRREIEKFELNSLKMVKTHAIYENYKAVLELMQQSVGEVECIEEQRLIRVEERRGMRTAEGRIRSDRSIINVVEEIPEKLMLHMRRVANRYSRVANELDSTYPERLFEQKDNISKEEFEQKFISMQEKVEKLNRYGISDIAKLKPVTFQEEYAKALKVYFEDFDRKYREYELLIDKLDLFTSMINRRFKFKQIEISNEDGIRIVDDNDRNLKLSKLSSGEKEILVLFYQLLFEVKDRVMLLVDEPEISLHIAWQRMFAEDLKKIVDKKHMRAIIATHSAQIINGNSKIQRDLGALYAEGLNQGTSK